MKSNSDLLGSIVHSHAHVLIDAELQEDMTILLYVPVATCVRVRSVYTIYNTCIHMYIHCIYTYLHTCAPFDQYTL